jgi:hypothetical protein
MLQKALTISLALASFGALGCDRPSVDTRPVAQKLARKTEQPQQSGAVAGKMTPESRKPSNASRRRQHDASDDWLPPLRAPGETAVVGAARSSWTAGIPFTESQALDRIERELKDALSVRPTLVVWLFDQSPAASPTRRALVTAAAQLHARLTEQAPPGSQRSQEAPKSNAQRLKLSTAMIAFGREVKVLTPEPVDEASRLPAAETIVETIAEEAATAGALAYRAVHIAAERFAAQRMRGQEVILVLAAHGAAADEATFKSAVAILNRAAIPVFGIGPAAPFGRLADSISEQTRNVGTALGHESLFPERVGLLFPDGSGDAELVDSGFGPFHLERICRATEGRFLRIRPAGASGWKTDEDGEIPSQLRKKYAPDYVSEAEYRKIISENRACQALHDAAQLAPARVLIAPTYEFRKEEEAAMARALSNAQRAPAENQAALEKLHETLAAGDSDRAKLTRPRWQAAFDLAYGRACAARARNEGYNHMLAVLKNGKASSKPDSNTWSLKPAEGIAGRSDLDKMAKTAKALLDRVTKEHAGTPWAALAQRELETPCGWEWTEK